MFKKEIEDYLLELMIPFTQREVVLSKEHLFKERGHGIILRDVHSNEEVIVDGNLDEATVNGPVDGKDHPGAHRETGYLVLCGHGSRVQFRRMRIREVPASSSETAAAEE